MRLVIDNISKQEAREIVNRQWGSTMWEVIDGKRCTFPTSKIEVSLFNPPTDIRMAQVKAGEQAVIDNLKN